MRAQEFRAVQRAFNKKALFSEYSFIAFDVTDHLFMRTSRRQIVSHSSGVNRLRVFRGRIFREFQEGSRENASGPFSPSPFRPFSPPFSPGLHPSAETRKLGTGYHSLTGNCQRSFPSAY